ncbi:SH3 domain-containing protein [Frigidibacter sp.]|uniref:SH3 domain-containing protein n=1 Tax=Frigidibacter sp. TaxID=2586418 RepID=UPI0027351B69|nr:SH3 domain-containing protein [Frigidibacter sp.]MDP3339334.1 SH3 domain-containing protein [Frigidibacter sp.]
MRRTLFRSVVAGALAAVLGAAPAAAGWRDRYEVHGVEDDDMLKMRAGPGTGYVVIAGLPNGTVLRVHSCQQTGGTRWCNVSLERARTLKGYVSWAYLRKM